MERITLGGHIEMRGHNRRLVLMAEVSEDKKSMKVGKALCSEKDVFSRHRAEQIINYRFSNPEKHKYTEHEGDFSTKSEVLKVMRDLKYSIIEDPSAHFKPYAR